MATVHIICGATEAGKTTYAYDLAAGEGGVRFSIDPWMQELFHPDEAVASFECRMERIERCENQIWAVAGQLLALEVCVIFDLGFTLRSHRDRHGAWARSRNAEVAVHFVDVPEADRRVRVRRRNQEQDSRVYSFEVTDEMFNFMESRFEPPDAAELMGPSGVEVD